MRIALLIAVGFVHVSTARADEAACRAAQAEGKGNLKALYVSEESFRAEFDTYSTDPAKIHFAPKGQKLRYKYAITSATKDKFTAEARAVLDGHEDVWRITELAQVENVVDGCGPSGAAPSPAASSATKDRPLPHVDLGGAAGPALTDPGEYKILIKSFAASKTKAGGAPWDSGGDPPDLIARLTYVDAQGKPKVASSSKAQNSFTLADVAFGPLPITRSSSITIAFVDSDALADDPVDTYTLTFEATKLDNGRSITLPPKPQTASPIEFEFQQTRSLAGTSPAAQKLVEGFSKIVQTKVGRTKKEIQKKLGGTPVCGSRKIENPHADGQYDDMETCEYSGVTTHVLMAGGKEIPMRYEVRDAKLLSGLPISLGADFRSLVSTLGEPGPKSTVASGAVYCATLKGAEDETCVSVLLAGEGDALTVAGIAMSTNVD